MKVTDLYPFLPNIKVSDLHGEHEYKMRFLPNNLQIDYDKYIICEFLFTIDGIAREILYGTKIEIVKDGRIILQFDLSACMPTINKEMMELIEKHIDKFDKINLNELVVYKFKLPFDINVHHKEREYILKITGNFNGNLYINMFGFIVKELYVDAVRGYDRAAV